jgi:hypothetical protein
MHTQYDEFLAEIAAEEVELAVTNLHVFAAGTPL